MEEALANVDLSKVRSVGVDEKAARRGHDYITLFVDLDTKKLIFATKNRTHDVFREFRERLEAQGGSAAWIREICMGMRRNESSEVPVVAENGRGCDHGDGGAGGAGGRTDQSMALPVRHFVGEGSKRTAFLASNGGNGGKGFPGKTRVVQLNKLSKGDSFDVTVGRGGRGGDGGEGFQQGSKGQEGANGFVLFVSLDALSQKKGECNA